MRKNTHPAVTAAAARTAVAVERLEARRLLAAPEILDPPFDPAVAEGESLYLPINTSDADGDPVSIGALVSPADQGRIEVSVVPQDNPFLLVELAGDGDPDAEGFDGGTMVFQLFEDVAPEAVRRIGGLAESGFYDGLEVPRVSPGFVFQFGSPFNTLSNSEIDDNGTPDDPTDDTVVPGSQSPQFETVGGDFRDEFATDLNFNGDGQLALANGGNQIVRANEEGTAFNILSQGKDANGSQVFVTSGANRFLDANHTIFGQLVRGFGVRNEIMALELEDGSETPVDPPVIERVRLIDNDTDAVLQISALPGAAAGGLAEVEVVALDDTGAESRRTFEIGIAPADQAEDSPPILRDFDDTLVTGAGETLSFDVDGVDAEGDALEYLAGIATDGPQGTTAIVDSLDGVGSVSVSGDGTVTFDPADDFTGQVELVVGVAQAFATGRGSTGGAIYDTQVVTVGVGDQDPVGAQGRDVAALRGAELQDAVVASFSDPDVDGSPGDFTAVIDWGDGTSSAGTVVEGDEPGTFDVLGSHLYDADVPEDALPISVAVIGDLGARIDVDSTAILGGFERDDDGDVRVTGTSGDDVFGLDVDGGDVILTFNGTAQSIPFADVGSIRIDAGAGDDLITLTPAAPASELIGGDGDDTIVGGLSDDTIQGGGGQDSLDGSGGNDRIDAGDGDDYVMGGTNVEYDEPTLAAGGFDEDTITGGAGDDTLSGGLDGNLIFGGDGDDLINGSGSRDTLDGGRGNDRLRGFGNADSLDGGAGDDTLEGDARTAEFPVRGGDFGEEVLTERERELIDGGLDDGDLLDGGDGDDVLFGRFDDDVLRGGNGADSLFGGDDADDEEEADEAPDFAADEGDIVDGVEILP